MTDIRQGWLCPKCGSAHAPDVLTCPEGQSVAPQVIPLWPPQFPYYLPMPVPTYPPSVWPISPWSSPFIYCGGNT